MSNLSAKNDQTKARSAKPSSISNNDKQQETEEKAVQKMKEGMKEEIQEEMQESDGLSAEEKLITQAAAEAQKAADVEGATKQKNSTRQREESQDEMLSSDSDALDTALANEDVDTTQEQITDLSDRLARALAEVENTRRRFQREKQDALRYGASQLAMDVFEVADNLQRARSFVSDEAMEKDANLKNLVLGIKMTEKSLEEAFKRNQIIAIVPKVGEPFSAEHHQAVSQVENDEIADGAVIELLQRGYRMGERLLRAAQVITAKSKNEDDEKTDASSNDALEQEEKPIANQDEE